MMTDYSSRASEGSQRRRSVWRVARGVDQKWQKTENYVYQEKLEMFTYK